MMFHSCSGHSSGEFPCFLLRRSMFFLTISQEAFARDLRMRNALLAHINKDKGFPTCRVLGVGTPRFAQLGCSA